MDVPVLGKRLNEYRNGFRIPEGMSHPNILSSGADTSDRTDYGRYSGTCPEKACLWLTVIDPSLDWESAIPWLRAHTSLKVWLKGGE